MHESFWTLLQDPAHWQFELFLIFIFDVVIGAVLWPYMKRWNKHHRSDDKKIADLEKELNDLYMAVMGHPSPTEQKKLSRQKTGG